MDTAAFKSDVIIRPSQKPFAFPINLGRGIYPAAGEGVAPQDPPAAEKNSRQNAEVVDTALGVFRARRLIQTGVAGEMCLIKGNEPYAKSPQIRIENRTAQKLTVLRTDCF